MATNGNIIYKRNFTWKIDNALSLTQENGQYLQSEIFTSMGPLGQEVQWALRLYPRGRKQSKNKNQIAVYLHLINGNGSKEITIDWKLAILNGEEEKINKHRERVCDYSFEEFDECGWGFDNFISRSTLANANKNYIVQGHQLVLRVQILIKAKKNFQTELMQEKKETRNLKRKLDSKENEIAKLKSENKRSEVEFLKLKLEKLVSTEKCLKEEKEKNIWKTKYEKLAENVRNSSKLIDEIESSTLEQSTSTNSMAEVADNVATPVTAGPSTESPIKMPPSPIRPSSRSFGSFIK